MHLSVFVVYNWDNSETKIWKVNWDCFAISEDGDNELLTLEIIHNYVELLDQYFGSVCELDIIYNYEKVTPLI